MKEIGVGEVASVSGRYYAMDRDNRWDRVEKAYKALVAGEGNTAESATAGIQASYDEDVTDEFVVPFVVTKGGAATATIKENDSVVFSTSVLTEQESSQEHSVTTALTDLTEETESRQHLYALQNTMLQSKINRSHL